MTARDTVGLALVGIGGWGRNLARNLDGLRDARLRWICDLDEARLAEAARQYPEALTTRLLGDLLDDPAVDAVVVATPAPTHHPIGKTVLRAGRDLYLEKPMVLDIAHGVELVRMAEAGGRVLMVGHLLEYHPVVLHLRNMIRAGELGSIHYIATQRLNLGTIRKDENVLWSLAPHDVSSILFMLGQEPSDVAARGQACVHRGVEDVAFMTMRFGDQSMAHVHVSWLDPHKTRKMTIVGSRRMAVFDDLESGEKLRIYDKGAEVRTNYDGFAEYVGLRCGDILVPQIPFTEPLRLELQHFVNCVRTRATPVSDGHDGLRVLRVLDAAERSLRNGGQPMRPAVLPDRIAETSAA
jgi:predicted dehydrogenase